MTPNAGWAARFVTVTMKIAYSPTLTCGLSTLTEIARSGGGSGQDVQPDRFPRDWHEQIRPFRRAVISAEFV